MVGGPGLEPGWVTPHAPQTCSLTSAVQLNLLTHTMCEFRVIEPISCRAIQMSGSVRRSAPAGSARPGCLAATSPLGPDEVEHQRRKFAIAQLRGAGRTDDEIVAPPPH